MKKEYTEDGAIVYVEIKKDLHTGGVFIANLTYLPTWVHKYTQKGRLVYEILPLNDTLGNFEYYNLLTGEASGGLSTGAHGEPLKSRLCSWNSGRVPPPPARGFGDD